MSIQDGVAVNGGGKQYGAKLTSQGSAAIAACILDGGKLEITYIAAGDGGGAYYEPLSDQTSLAREVWRGEVLACEKNPLSPNTLDIKGVIPSDVGGFVVRELGVFDKDGALIGLCNTPDMEKMAFASGAGGKLDLIMHLLVTDANAVEVFVKPSLDTISLEDARKLVEDGLKNTEQKLGEGLEKIRDQVNSIQEDIARQLGEGRDEILAAAQEKVDEAKAAANIAADLAQAASTKAESLISYGTTDLTAGSSDLATGKVYLVYK